jgi:hypothetical protein
MALGSAVAPTGYAAYHLGGSYTGTTGINTFGIYMDGIITGTSGNTAKLIGMRFNNTFVTQTASENIAVLSQVMFDKPDVTDNLTGDITIASTLYIDDAPTAGVTNAAIYVASGAIQIGTALVAPEATAADFVISGGDDQGISIQGTGTGRIHFGDAGDADIGRIIYDHGTDSLSLYANATQYFSVRSDGDIGIAAASRIYFDGVGASGDTYIHESSANILDFVVGAATGLTIQSTGAVFNEDSNDYDFRIESNNNSTIFQVNGGTDSLSIGGSPVDYVQAYFGGRFTSGGASTIGYGSMFTTAFTAHSGDTSHIGQVNIDGGSVTTASTGTYTWATALRISEPNLTEAGTATITNAATLLIANAPTEATTNYGIMSYAVIAGAASDTGTLFEGRNSSASDRLDLEIKNNSGGIIVNVPTGTLEFDYNGTQMLNVNSTGVVVNEDSGSNDFRVETNQYNDIIQVDGGEDWVQLRASNTNLGTDHTASGIIVDALADITGINIGDAVYVKSDGDFALADADATTTMPVVGIAIENSSVGVNMSVLTHGVIRDNTWAWTVGGLVYVSTTGTTGNTLTQTAPSGTGDQVQVVGVALSADKLFVNPSLTVVEVA